MITIVSLLKKELKSYLDQPTGYILLIIFVSLNAFLFFRTALTTSEASLVALFSTLPWILIVFVSASTMRLLSEEQRDGTLEIILTQPIPAWYLLIGKFLAGLTFVLIGIICTMFIPISLQTAGSLDIGASISQYLGIVLLTALFVSIGLFSSSVTRNQIVAFMIGLSITLLLMLAGMPLITLTLPSWLGVLVQDLSPLTHFASLSKGVITIADIIYFIAITVTFISAAFLWLRAKTVSKNSQGFLNLQLGVLGILVISLLIGWFGGLLLLKFDITDDRIYTLSKASEKFISEIDDIVTIKLFTSNDPPVQVALRTREVENFLAAVAAKSNGKIRVLKRSPGFAEDDVIEAAVNRVYPVQFNVETQGGLEIKEGYLGISMTYSNKLEAIPFVESLEGLENQLMSALYRMAQKEPQAITMLFGNGEKRRDAMLQSLRNELERHYKVVEFEFSQGFLDTGTDVLIVPGATEWMESVLIDNIDEYLANGGKAFILTDSVLVDPSAFEGSSNRYGLNEWLKQYGLKIDDGVVFDTKENETVDINASYGTVTLPYPYWIRTSTVESAVSGGLIYAVIPHAGVLQKIPPMGDTVEIQSIVPLLVTSDSAGIDTMYDDVSVNSEVPEMALSNDLNTKTLAYAVTGTRCPPFKPNCREDPSYTIKPFRLIVVADSDWITEPMVQAYPKHITLANNWINWLSQEDALAAIRTKGLVLRPLVFETVLHRNFVQYGNIIFIPFLIAVIGLIRFFIRRKLMMKEYSREE